MPATDTRPPRSAADTAGKAAKADKRAAILAAALRLIARSGLHDTPMSALAHEAGVGAGTVYRYFPSKEAMINALYLELLEDEHRATAADAGSPAAIAADPGGPDPGGPDPGDTVWRAWHGLARWHLDHPEASNVMHQCRASGILTPATRDREQRAKAVDLARFGEAVARGIVRDLPREVFWALFTGPIFALAEMRGAGELDVTDAVLRATFDGVGRGVLPAHAAHGEPGL